MPSPRVSLCMIVKNEAANLPDCVGPIAPLVHEVVLADTGSTDDTRAVGERLGARVIDVPWVQSFAAARNASIQAATGDWIFWLDGDERLDADNLKRLQALLANLSDKDVAYYLWTRIAWSNGRTTNVDHVRLFRKRRDIRWKYRVHEQLMCGNDWLRDKAKPSDVVIEHAGYQDSEAKVHKDERNLTLLELDRRDNPYDPLILFNLGWTLLRLKRPAEALPHLQHGLRFLTGNFISIQRQLYLLLTQAYEQTGNVAAALATCSEGRARYPADPDLNQHEQRLQAMGGNYTVRGW